MSKFMKFQSILFHNQLKKVSLTKYNVNFRNQWLIDIHSHGHNIRFLFSTLCTNVKYSVIRWQFSWKLILKQ